MTQAIIGEFQFANMGAKAAYGLPILTPAFPSPLCARFFGKRAELFRYRFVGRHSVQSGFTSLVQAHELQQLLSAPPQRANRKQAALDDRSWLNFLQHMKGSSGEGIWPTPELPFLFAGERAVVAICGVGLYLVCSFD
jgi:hypothetical protein